MKKAYKARRVLVDATFSCSKGEIVGLLGRNGAGKSTLLNVVCGTLRADSGSVVMRGSSGERDITNATIRERAEFGLAYLPQNAFLFAGLSVRQNLVGTAETLASLAESERRTGELFSTLRIGHLADMMPRQLSGGQFRIAALARVLIREPSFVLLDEPFSGIDPLSIEHLKAIVRRASRFGACFLITDHNARDVMEVVERAYILDGGTMRMSGLAADLATSPEAKALYFGKSLERAQGHR